MTLPVSDLVSRLVQALILCYGCPGCIRHLILQGHLPGSPCPFCSCLAGVHPSRRRGREVAVEQSVAPERIQAQGNAQGSRLQCWAGMNHPLHGCSERVPLEQSRAWNHVPDTIRYVTHQCQLRRVGHAVSVCAARNRGQARAPAPALRAASSLCTASCPSSRASVEVSCDPVMQGGGSSVCK